MKAGRKGGVAASTTAQHHRDQRGVASRNKDAMRSMTVVQAGGQAGGSDQREALFNGGAIGVFSDVMVQEHEVTLVRGILLEIDGECLNFGGILGPPCLDGTELYERHVRKWLDNHPVLRKCEVRFSGRWVHCILRFAKPVEIRSDRQRELWKTLIRAVQRSLPTDPEAPSLLAMTRPIGSVNSKTGRGVELLRAGDPVTVVEVLQFGEDLTRRAFATTAQILFGTTTVSPCPICREEESILRCNSSHYRTTNPKITNRGSCYHCGRVTLADMIGLVLKGREDSSTVEQDEHGADGAARAVVAEKVSERDQGSSHNPAEGRGGQ